MFFEKNHSVNSEEFIVSAGRNFSFLSHIHRAFELYLQVSGTAEVIIDKKVYNLCAGQAVLIFPFQYHSYKALENSANEICIFSPDLVPGFYGTEKRIPTDNLFEFHWNRKTADNPYLYAAIAYDICGQFDKKRNYIEKKDMHSHDRILPILLYINENYKNRCLLSDAVATVQFDYAYISKLFKKCVGIEYNKYVNHLRIQESKKLLKTTKNTITEIAYECGFSSLRSFNRKFAEIEGMTPSAYRKQ